jgi:hypothetical protein
VCTMKSPRYMAALAVLIGLCVCKPPEWTRLSTAPSFSLTRCASSYLPRKQQRVRVPSFRILSAQAARAIPHDPDATIIPSERPSLSWNSRLADEAVRIRPVAGIRGMAHPLRC